MAYLASAIDRAYVLRWTAEPALGDVSSIIDEVSAIRRTVGQPILYLGIIPSRIPMPKSAVRDAFTNSFGRMAELCACLDILIEDTDVRATLIRTMVRAMALAVPARKMHVFGSPERLADQWKRLYAVDAHDVLARFREFEGAKVA